MSKRHVVLSALAIGLFSGSMIDIARESAKPEPQVYSEPSGVRVVRTEDRITYTALGRKLMKCDIYNRFYASIQNDAGKELDLAVIRQPDGTRIGGEDYVSVAGGDSFRADGLWFVAKNAKIQDATQFYVTVRCWPREGEQILAKFGPMPIPDVGGVYEETDPDPVTSLRSEGLVTN
jgi:hypothetical protein